MGNNAPAAGIPAAPYVTPPYICLTNYYVSKTGNDSNDGATNSPWLTIQHAVNALGAGAHGGVCVNVGDGTYTEAVFASGVGGAADTPSGYLVFRSQNLHGATVQMPAALSTNYSACFQFNNSSYVIVDGFNLAGLFVTNSIEKGFAANRSSATASPSHHFKVLNSIIYDHGGAGIGFTYTDYIDLEGNVIYTNAGTSIYEESGITDWHPVACDLKPGFHNIIADNIVFNNAEVNDGHATHTDGNGIIMDDFRDSDGTGPYYGPYTPELLVENNLVFGNGGGGVHLYESDYVTVRNNTAYHNYLDPLNTGTWRGDINALFAGNNRFVNNIAVADPVANANNTAYADAATDGNNISNVWQNNLSFNGAPGQPSIFISGSPSTITAAHGNVLGKNPLFNDPENGGFTLQATSPAINAGTSAYGIPFIDLAGDGPANGVVDMGAYEFAPPPRLCITSIGSEVLLSWPSEWGGFSLESTTNLNSPDWTLVSNLIPLINDSFVYSNAASGPAQFFRLEQ
jgi:serralysin